VLQRWLRSQQLSPEGRPFRVIFGDWDEQDAISINHRQLAASRTLRDLVTVSVPSSICAARNLHIQPRSPHSWIPVHDMSARSMRSMRSRSTSRRKSRHACAQRSRLEA
jgi:hypothetical protein